MTLHVVEFVTEGEHDWTVPDHLHAVTVKITGAAGGLFIFDNGTIEVLDAGMSLTALDLPVTPGETIRSVIGGPPASDGTGGSNGGGSGFSGRNRHGYWNGSPGGDDDDLNPWVTWNNGGGGATDIRRGGTSVDDQVLVAGGAPGRPVGLYAQQNGDVPAIPGSTYDDPIYGFDGQEFNGPGGDGFDDNYQLVTSMPTATDLNRVPRTELWTPTIAANAGDETTGGAGVTAAGSLYVDPTYWNRSVMYGPGGGGGFGGGAGGAVSGGDYAGHGRFGTCFTAYPELTGLGGPVLVGPPPALGVGVVQFSWETSDGGWSIDDVPIFP